MGILVLETKRIECVGDTHRDAFRAALREDVRTVHLLAIDFTALEKLTNLLEFGVGLGRREIAIVLLLECRLDFRLGEPILAIGPSNGIRHCRQGPVVRRALWPFRIAGNRGLHEIVHRDFLFGEEVVELHVVAILRRTSDPLTVANDQVAQLAARVELIEKAIGVARPRDELVLHLDAGLLGEILAQFHERVCRIPGRPAQRQLLALGRRLGSAEHPQRCSRQHHRRGTA